MDKTADRKNFKSYFITTNLRQNVNAGTHAYKPLHSLWELHNFLFI